MEPGIVDRVRARVQDGALLAPGAPVVVLLSGGRDSVCLLDVAVAVAGPAAVRALHVDHGLRADAHHDRAVCADLCAALGVPLEVHRASAPPARGNLQAWGREERYAAGARAASAHPGAVLAVAHTATDQVETILYRLASSPGRRALLGMEERRDPIVRPLLSTSREETGAYCAARGLAYADDPTNATDAYARNRVRHDLVPALRAVHPAAERNVLRTAVLLRDEAEVLDAVVAAELGEGGDIALERLAALPRALARLVVRRLAEDATGSFCARAAGRVDDVLALGDGALDLGDGARAVVTGGRLRVERTPPLPPRHEPAEGGAL